MTFKHMKFEDSPTMRALEKVAKEKGLVKPETLEKKASVTKKADYTPTPNLMENILKLCAGLRTQGLAKEAAELETNFLNYKQAQTLYETSKEKGEDLVNDAHPKGSHKLEGVEGEEATFETILDQHLKHLQMIEKKPTGKLSTASILKSVKKALGQEQKYTPDQIGNWYRVQTIGKLEAAANTASAGMGILQNAVRAGYIEQSRTVGADYEDITEGVQKARNAWQRMYTGGQGGRANLNVNDCNEMIEGYNAAIQKTTEAFGYSQDESRVNMRDGALTKLRTAVARVKECITTIQAYNADPNSLPIGVLPPQITQTQQQQVDFSGQVKALDAKHQLYVSMHYENKVPPAAKAKITNFLAGIGSNLTILKGYLGKPDTELAAVRGDLDKLIADVTSKLNQFKTSVIDKAPATGPTG